MLCCGSGEGGQRDGTGQVKTVYAVLFPLLSIRQVGGDEERMFWLELGRD